ncbi:MAG: GNAT family N-acetyltransferase, partial [Lachnoclostridium sp.]|nr:GNAT family N-acetyltransferase [Lachnoclostridium sp.]
MDINLRLIQQESIQDRENYFALQKSVALFPNKEISDKEGYEDRSWHEQFENKNRICYVIEMLPESTYCGECAVKDISDDIPEIEIELMKEHRHQGIGYKAIIMMLSQIVKEYGKQEFYVKIEPDNYAS